MLASEYGWGKWQILEEVYPEEIPGYRAKITKRKALNRMQELEISSVAFSGGKARQKLYNEYRKLFQGAEPYVPKEEELDEAGFNRLKKMLFNK